MAEQQVKSCVNLNNEAYSTAIQKANSEKTVLLSAVQWMPK